MGPRATTLKEHLQHHDLITDPEVKRHHDLLVGENENDGLCKDVSDMQKVQKTLSDGFREVKKELLGFGLGIMGTIIIEFILTRIFK